MPARLLAFCRGFALKKKKLGLLPCYVSLYYLFPNSCKSESLLLVAFLPSNLEKGLFFLCSSSTDPVFGFHISPLPVYFDTFLFSGRFVNRNTFSARAPPHSESNFIIFLPAKRNNEAPFFVVFLHGTMFIVYYSPDETAFHHFWRNAIVFGRPSAREHWLFQSLFEPLSLLAAASSSISFLLSLVFSISSPLSLCIRLFVSPPLLAVLFTRLSAFLSYPNRDRQPYDSKQFPDQSSQSTLVAPAKQPHIYIPVGLLC